MKREEAIQVLQTALTSPFIYGEYADAISMAIESLKNEPILCKDCKRYSVEGEITQFGWCNALEMPTDEQRFCADGERKSGDVE